MTSTVEALEASGHQVILVQTIPTYRNPPPLWDPRSCSLMAVANGTCARHLPTAFVDDLQRASRTALEDVARSTNASILDLRSWFCNSDTCSTDRSGVLQYQDATHISVAASKALSPLFADAVGAVSDHDESRRSPVD